MVDTDQQAVEEIVHEGDALGTRRIIDILERYHDDRPGVPTEALASYARELSERDDSSFDVAAFEATVDERRTDADSWVADDDCLYELDGDRISQYPASWHDRLGGESDPAAYLRFFEERVQSVLTQHGGVNEDHLIDVMAVVGGLDRDVAKGAIESARDDRRVVEDADQHPKAGVYLAE